MYYFKREIGKYKKESEKSSTNKTQKQTCRMHSVKLSVDQYSQEKTVSETDNRNFLNWNTKKIIKHWLEYSLMISRAIDDKEISSPRRWNNPEYTWILKQHIYLWNKKQNEWTNKLIITGTFWWAT